MAKTRRNLMIKELPPELRPRERLIHAGAESLSSVELLAIVLGTGSRFESTLQIGGRLLSEFKTLSWLANSTLEELCKIEGIGEAKAAKLLAALEIGRRLNGASPVEKVMIGKPDDVSGLLMSQMRYLDREHFKALLLNTKNHVLRIADISIGSLNSSIVHPRELFKMAIRHNAAAVITVHNHPSGDPTPSAEDVALTKRLVKAGTILGIDLLDHIVLGDGRFVSLKEQNLM